jgi:hypothetical protein
MTHSGIDRVDERRGFSALRALYVDLDLAVAASGPICRLSGRCCRFVEWDHTLFVSALEAAVLLADAPPPVRPLDDGATCPWQDAHGRCTARDARPLGCRVYYCDPSFQDRGPELCEIYLARLKRLVEDHGLPWDYAPLHNHLRRMTDAGRFLTSRDEPVRFRLDTTPSQQ